MRFYTKLKEIDKSFMPKERGILTESEVAFIDKNLELNSLSVDDLRNLRDFAVLLLTPRDGSNLDEVIEKADKVSAITCVIDHKLFSLGETV